MRGRTIGRLVLAAAYAFAGIAHLSRPAGFLAITPHWVPMPELVVALTGVAELAGAIGLMIPRLRSAAGMGLALYALCVWPANINHAINDIPLGGAHLSWWYHGPRLALQPVIIWWALWASGVTDWPFRRR
ncbi:DoxX family protein [Sphingobium cupriresistens]|uniref:Membrane protein n=1 Tax=Sphingobium cupriresistens LL01 TaxID=1420583 RepID=A0A0J7XZN9_9SPHN|nr:DoxX family protein [Sphingobium cupriresistens]KMS56992.1 membrane protein [Sphingobium cupriresistens LL01]